jgi:hypothetical protein
MVLICVAVRFVTPPNVNSRYGFAIFCVLCVLGSRSHPSTSTTKDPPVPIPVPSIPEIGNRVRK